MYDGLILFMVLSGFLMSKTMFLARPGAADELKACWSAFVKTEAKGGPWHHKLVSPLCAVCCATL